MPPTGKGVCSQCAQDRHYLCVAPEACMCPFTFPGRAPVTMDEEQDQVPVEDGTDFVWEVPPPANRGSSGGYVLSDEAIAACKAHPGQWIKRVPPFSSNGVAVNAAKRVRRGGERLGPGWEAATRGKDLYVRWIGDK